MSSKYFETYIPTDVDTFKEYFTLMSQGKIEYGEFSELKQQNNQKGAGDISKKVELKIITPTQAIAEQAESLSVDDKSKSASGIKRKIEKIAEENTKKLHKPIKVKKAKKSAVAGKKLK